MEIQYFLIGDITLFWNCIKPTPTQGLYRTYTLHRDCIEPTHYTLHRDCIEPTHYTLHRDCIEPEAEFKEFVPRLKFQPPLKYGWFHLKLY